MQDSKQSLRTEGAVVIEAFVEERAGDGSGDEVKAEVEGGQGGHHGLADTERHS